ncbi:MAG: hypothetical protein ACFFA1_04950 [Promethearchaeota archaeon]
MLPIIIGTITGELIIPLIKDEIKRLAGWLFDKLKRKVKKGALEKELSKVIVSGDVDDFFKKYSEVLTQNQIEQIRSLVALKDSAVSAAHIINKRLYEEKNIRKLEEFMELLKDVGSSFHFGESLRLKVTDPDTDKTVKIDDINYALALFAKLIGSAYTQSARRSTPYMKGWALGYEAKVKVEVSLSKWLEKQPSDSSRWVGVSKLMRERHDHVGFLDASRRIIEAYQRGRKASDIYDKAVESFTSASYYVQNASVKEEYHKLSKDYLEALVLGFKGEAKYWLSPVLSATTEWSMGSIIRDLELVLGAPGDLMQRVYQEFPQEESHLLRTAISEYNTLKMGRSESFDLFSEACNVCPEGSEKATLEKRKKEIREVIDAVSGIEFEKLLRDFEG